tara:strand:- start:5220 stop:5492 length:273 start_codon:yes stop_codon:yes gene_type:complete
MGLKNKYANPLPNYSASNKENEWYRYCVNKNIRISHKPVDGEKGKWYITVSLGPYKKGEVPHVSPSIYTKDNVMQAYYQMCKYYYDKREK